jgi:photosystem II stability/assembly factor-like uncharacterized protein
MNITGGTSVSFCDSLNGFIAAGTHVLHTTDGGTTWMNQSISAYGNAVACVNPHKALAVGFWGSVLLTNDGGSTWGLYSKSPYSPVFSSIALANGKNEVAVATNSVFRTSDSGVTWLSNTISGALTLNSVAYADSNTVITVGDSGKIYRATDGGITWNKVTSGTSSDLYGVSFADSHTGFAVGGYVVGQQKGNPIVYRTIVKTTDGGKSWSTALSDSGNTLSAVACIDPQTAVAVGRSYSGWHQYIIRTTNGGNSWATVSDTVVPYDLLSIAFFNRDTGIAVGSNAVLLRTTDGGAQWNPVQSGAQNSLYSVATAKNTQIGAAAGRNGTIVLTTDGGADWHAQQSNTSADLFGIAFADSNIATVAGGTEVNAGQPHGVILRTQKVVPALPHFVASSSHLDFGNVLLGYQREDSLVIRNTGPGDLAITLAIPTDLTFSARPGSQIISAGEQRVFYVSFKPVDIQTRNAYFIFYSNAYTSPDSVLLTGKGYGGAVFAAGLGIDFGEVRVGIVAQDSLPIYNRGDITLTLNSIVSTDSAFSVKETNGTIAAGDSMMLHISYTPDAAHGNGGYIRIIHNGATSPDSVSIVGTGVPSLIVSGDTLNFGRVHLGSNRVLRFAALNTRALFINFDSIVVTDTHFVAVPGLRTLYGGDTMQIPVTFTPESARAYNGFILVYTTGEHIPDTVVVSGAGTGPLFASEKKIINFGEVLPGNSKVDSFRVYNHGDTVLDISSLLSTETVFTASPDSLKLTPGDSATVAVTFTPLLQQEYSAYLLVASNAASSPDTVILIGSPASDVTPPLAPNTYALYQNYPNPFRNTTSLCFGIPQTSRVDIAVYDIFGQQIASLGSGIYTAGEHTVLFNAGALPAGIYICKVHSGAWTATQKILLVH